MASHQGFVDYVAEQLREAGIIRSRKMFGEYGLYCDGIFFAVICDDQLFVKVTPAGEAELQQFIQNYTELSQAVGNLLSALKGDADYE